MGAISVFALLACLILYVNPEEKRWVWQDKKHDSKLAYEVIDDIDGRRPFNGGLLQRPSRPIGVKPSAVAPTPSGGYGLVNHPYKPGGVIVGPEPTWSRPRPLPVNSIDKCKCTEKFNCPTPGLSYGNCDVGKSYCCYSSKAGNLHPEPLLPAGRPIHSPENGVLVGPGGPIDYPKPIYNRPGGGYGLTNGVLAGPTARPPYYQQQNNLGVPYSPGIRPRSNNN